MVFQVFNHSLTLIIFVFASFLFYDILGLAKSFFPSSNFIRFYHPFSGKQIQLRCNRRYIFFVLSRAAGTAFSLSVALKRFLSQDVSVVEANPKDASGGHQHGPQDATDMDVDFDADGPPLDVDVGALLL